MAERHNGGEAPGHESWRPAAFDNAVLKPELRPDIDAGLAGNALSDWGQEGGGQEDGGQDPARHGNAGSADGTGAGDIARGFDGVTSDAPSAPPQQLVSDGDSFKFRFGDRQDDDSRQNDHHDGGDGHFSFATGGFDGEPHDHAEQGPSQGQYDGPNSDGTGAAGASDTHYGHDHFTSAMDELHLQAAHTLAVTGGDFTPARPSDLLNNGDPDTDVFRGGTTADEVDGAAGDDWLRGGHGNDTLDGGAGSDIVDGGSGDDTLLHNVTQNLGEVDYYDGGKGSDTLVLQMSADDFATYQADLITLQAWIGSTANTNCSSGHGFNDFSAHSEQHPIYVTQFGLVVRNVEDLKIYVDGFDDSVDPVDGPPDIIIDLPPEPDPPPDIVIDLLSASTAGISTNSTMQETDTTGTSGADTLTGTDGANHLYGLGGNDTLAGGKGDDTLTGGTGDDRFVFAAGDGADTITDFAAGDGSPDMIDLRQVNAVASFADVMAAAAQIGGDTVIDFGHGDSITLLGVETTQLTDQDFLL